MRAVTRRWIALRSALVVVFAVLASYSDNLFNLSAHELKGGKGDGSGWGGADEVGAAPAVKCGDTALAVNAANEVADAAKRTEAVDVHVGSNHLVRVRHRRCDHLGKGAGEHEVHRGDFVEEHAALRALVRRIAHSYRMFLVVTTLACLGECFAASLYAVSVHGRHGDGDADVPSDVSSDVSSDVDRRDLKLALRSAVPSALRLLTHAWGTALNLRAATLATHRMQKSGSYLSERHARITAQLCAASDSRVHERVVHERAVEAFAARHAAVGSFRDNKLGISVFGFVLDREFLRTFHAALVALALFVAARALTEKSHR